RWYALKTLILQGASVSEVLKMLSQARKRREERAIGDGNCAYNALVLGLCESTVLNNIHLPDNDYFVIEASRRLRLVSPFTWQALKAHLLSPSVSRNLLQKRLSPLLREIKDSVELQEKTELTIPAIQAELAIYFRELETKPHSRINMAAVGDIFIRHAFIKD